MVENIVLEYPDMDSNPYGYLPAGQRATLSATAFLYNCRLIDSDIDFEGISILELNSKSDFHIRGYLIPDTKEDLDSLKAGEPMVLMWVIAHARRYYIVLRKLTECDCTFQRIGYVYRIQMQLESRPRSCGCGGRYEAAHYYHINCSMDIAHFLEAQGDNNELEKPASRFR